MSSAPIPKTAGGNAAFHNFHNDFAHIQDPNERRRLALAEIDKAPFGWYHVRACVVAGIGFFTDSYDVSSYRLQLPPTTLIFGLRSSLSIWSLLC
jgi:PHS family inorganic phosphate transporter-like MFS transporter